jgi:hypothetical protein
MTAISAGVKIAVDMIVVAVLVVTQFSSSKVRMDMWAATTHVHIALPMRSLLFDVGKSLLSALA